MAIQQAIQELQGEIGGRYPVLLDYLLPGIQPEVLFQKFEEIGYHPSQELYEFYKWTLWVDFERMYADKKALAFTLFIGYYPSYPDIENLSKNIIDIAGTKYWLFMKNDFGDFMAVEMAEQPVAIQVIQQVPEGLDYNFPDEELEDVFESVEKLIRTITVGLQEEVVYYESENGVDELIEEDEFDAVGRRLNPGMNYWLD